MTDYCRDFSSFLTWDMIRLRREHVPWHKLILFKQRVPRFTFITWLAVKDQLSGVKMCTWRHTQGCLFCGEPEETRDHFFRLSLYLYNLATCIGIPNASSTISGLGLECPGYSGWFRLFYCAHPH